MQPTANENDVSNWCIVLRRTVLNLSTAVWRSSVHNYVYRMSCMRPLVCRPGDLGRVCCRTTTSSSISRCTCARSCLRCAAATTSPSDPTTSPSRSVLHLTTGIRPGHHLRWDIPGPRSERAAICCYMLLTFTLSNLFCTNVLHQHVHYT